MVCAPVVSTKLSARPCVSSASSGGGVAWFRRCRQRVTVAAVAAINKVGQRQAGIHEPTGDVRVGDGHRGRSRSRARSRPGSTRRAPRSGSSPSSWAAQNCAVSTGRRARRVRRPSGGNWCAREPVRASVPVAKRLSAASSSPRITRQDAGSIASTWAASSSTLCPVFGRSHIAASSAPRSGSRRSTACATYPGPSLADRRRPHLVDDFGENVRGSASEPRTWWRGPVECVALHAREDARQRGIAVARG